MISSRGSPTNISVEPQYDRWGQRSLQKTRLDARPIDVPRCGSDDHFEFWTASTSIVRTHGAACPECSRSERGAPGYARVGRRKIAQRNIGVANFTVDLDSRIIQLRSRRVLVLARVERVLRSWSLSRIGAWSTRCPFRPDFKRPRTGRHAGSCAGTLRIDIAYFDRSRWSLVRHNARRSYRRILESEHGANSHTLGANPHDRRWCCRLSRDVALIAGPPAVP